MFTAKEKFMMLTALDTHIQCSTDGPVVTDEYLALEAKVRDFDAENIEANTHWKRGYEFRKFVEASENAALCAEIERQVATTDPEEAAEELASELTEDEAINLFHALADRLGCGVTFPCAVTEKGVAAVNEKGEWKAVADVGAAQWTPEEIERFNAEIGPSWPDDDQDPKKIDEVFGAPEISSADINGKDVFAPLKGDGFSDGEHASGNAEVMVKPVAHRTSA